MAFCDPQLAPKRILICAPTREISNAFHYTSTPGHSDPDYGVTLYIVHAEFILYFDDVVNKARLIK